MLLGAYLVQKRHLWADLTLHLALHQRHTRSARANCAAVNRAPGTRNGEHDT